MLQDWILTSFLQMIALLYASIGKYNLQEQQHILFTFKLQVEVSLTDT